MNVLFFTALVIAMSRFSDALLSKLKRSSSIKNYVVSGSESDPTKRKMSWPFNNIDAPDALDGSLPGDAGFDPLGIATKENIYALREMEIKNGRIAMLSAVGWPSAELSHLIIATRIGKESILGDNGRAPSVLNGGLNNTFSLFALGVFFAVGAVLELELMRKKKLRDSQPEILSNFFEMYEEDESELPGNYGWDPLNLKTRVCNDDPEKKKLFQTIEIFNARVSMLAMVGYIVQETITGLPVVKETPQFFTGILTPGM
jgi:hypothetical protein